jgi:gem associated protein 2
MFVPKTCLPVVECPLPSSQRRRKRCKTSNDTDSTARDAGTTEIDAEQDDSVDDTANAYLFRVREEARVLPKVWTADTPPTTTSASTVRAEVTTSTFNAIKVKKKPSANRQGVFGSTASTVQYLRQAAPDGVEVHDVVPPPTPWHIPTAQRTWVQQIGSSFSDLRSYLEQWPRGGANPPSLRQPLPPMKDTVAWCTFCLGPGHGYYIETNDNVKVAPSPSSQTPIVVVSAWETDIPTLGHAPTVRLLLQMDQVMVRRILEHLTLYIVTTRVRSRPGDAAASSQHHYRPQVFPWIYALLARLAKPIHRDDAVTLYRLLKRLTFLRSQIPTPNSTRLDSAPESTSTDRTFLATLNVLIVIVGIYFEQGGNYSNLMEVKAAPILS